MIQPAPSPRRPFAKRRQEIDSVVVVGCGDVVRHRYLPAYRLLADRGVVRKLVLIDVAAECPVPLRPGEMYLSVQPGERVRMEPLARQVPLGPRTLVVVATSTKWHVEYIRQFLHTGCRVAVEKPIAIASRDVAAIPSHPNLYAVDHFLFKKILRDFLLLTRAWPGDGLRHLKEIQFECLENRDIGGRAVDPITMDTGIHAFAAIGALCRAYGVPADIRVESCLAARYRPGLAVTTAARIDGTLAVAARDIPFFIRLGKAMRTDRKSLVLVPHVGQPTVIDLSESGWAAHYRVLRSLLSPRPQMFQTFADAVAGLRSCERAANLQDEGDPYPPGTTPPFLIAEHAVVAEPLPFLYQG